MDDVESVAMIDGLEERLHVTGGNLLCEGLVLLGGDHLEELPSMDVLHHQVDVLLIVIGLVVLDNMRMVELVKNSNLLHDAVNVLSQLLLVKHLDGHQVIWIEFVVGLEDSAKGTSS